MDHFSLGLNDSSLIVTRTDRVGQIVTELNVGGLNIKAPLLGLLKAVSSHMNELPKGAVVDNFT